MAIRETWDNPNDTDAYQQDLRSYGYIGIVASYGLVSESGAPVEAAWQAKVLPIGLHTACVDQLNAKRHEAYNRQEHRAGSISLRRMPFRAHRRLTWDQVENLAAPTGYGFTAREALAEAARMTIFQIDERLAA